MKPPRTYLFMALIVSVGSLAGCDLAGKDAAPPPLPELPPPVHPSAAEIADEIDVGLAPLDDIASFEAGITPQLREQLTSYLQTVKRQHSATEWGSQGLSLAVHRLGDRLETARENMHTDMVLFLCDLIETLDPENTRLPRFREWAQIHMERPEVKIVGWFEFEEPRYGADEIYVLLDVFIPATGQRERPRVQEGEEFLGLKFHRIIGKKRGVLLEYLETKDRFAVYGPGSRAAVRNAAPRL